MSYPDYSRKRHPRYNEAIPVQIRFSAGNIIGVIAALAALDVAVKVGTKQLQRLINRLDRMEASHEHQHQPGS